MADKFSGLYPLLTGYRQSFIRKLLQIRQCLLIKIKLKIKIKIKIKIKHANVMTQLP